MTYLTHHPDANIYPGQYVPLYSEMDYDKKEIKSSRHFGFDDPESITDLGNCYLIELHLQGIRREEFQLEVCGNILSVTVIPNDQKMNRMGEAGASANIFDKSFVREFVLPDDADPLFVSAEFNTGMLEVYVPKAKHPLRWINTKIAVY